MKSLKNGRIGNALTWAIRSQDGTFTSYLADRFLREYCSSGKLRNTDLLDNLGSCMLVSDKLIFLGTCNFIFIINTKGDSLLVENGENMGLELYILSLNAFERLRKIIFKRCNKEFL